MSNNNSHDAAKQWFKDKQQKQKQDVMEEDSTFDTNTSTWEESDSPPVPPASKTSTPSASQRRRHSKATASFSPPMTRSTRKQRRTSESTETLLTSATVLSSRHNKNSNNKEDPSSATTTSKTRSRRDAMLPQTVSMQDDDEEEKKMKEDDAPMTLLETENNITKAPTQRTSVSKDTLHTAAVTTPRRSSRRSVATLQNTPASTTKRKCSMPAILDVDSPVMSHPRSSLEESPPKKHCASKSMLPQIENELIMDDSRPAKNDHTDPDENMEPTEQNLSAQLDASAVTNEGTVAPVENAVSSTAHVSWDMPVAYKPKKSPAYEMEYYLESPISTKAGTQWTNTTCTRGTIHHVETAVLPPPQQHMVQSLCDKLPRNTPSRTAAKGLVQKRIAELEEVVVVEQDCRMRHITDKENMVPFTMVADDKPVSQSFATTTNRWEDSFSRHGAVYRDTAIKVKKSAGIPSWMMVLGVVALYLAILAPNLPKGAYPGLLFRRNTMHGKNHQMTGAAKQSTVLNVVEPKPLQFKSTLKVVPSLATPPLTEKVEEPELPVESKPLRFKPTLKVVPNPEQQSTTEPEPQTVLPLQSKPLKFKPTLKVVSNPVKPSSSETELSVESEPLKFKPTLKVVPNPVKPHATDPELPVQSEPLKYKPTLKVVPNPVKPSSTETLLQPEKAVESKPFRFKTTLKVVPNPTAPLVATQAPLGTENFKVNAALAHHCLHNKHYQLVGDRETATSCVLSRLAELAIDGLVRTVTTWSNSVKCNGTLNPYFVFRSGGNPLFDYQKLMDLMQLDGWDKDRDLLHAALLERDLKITQTTGQTRRVLIGLSQPLVCDSLSEL